MSLAALNAALAQIVGVVDGTFYRPHRSRSATARLTAFVVAPGIKASTILTELRKRIDPLFLPRPLHLCVCSSANARHARMSSTVSAGKSENIYFRVMSAVMPAEHVRHGYAQPADAHLSADQCP